MRPGSCAECERILLHSILVALLFITLVPFSQSEAAFTSSITPDGTLGTGVAKSGSTYNINGGTIKGTNQFHSFGHFSVGTGDTASFNGPSGILNILSRVTGGQQSQIDGTIKSTIQGANLYLMNPAGVLFGPNASLNLSGSFHVTTADYLRLTDGVRFNAVPGPQDALLTTAPVAAFGFLSTLPATISIEGSVLGVPEGQALSIIAGNIEMQGGMLNAPAGHIQMTSMSGPAEAILVATHDELGTNVPLSGQIVLSDNALLTISGRGGGTIVLEAGLIDISGSSVQAVTLGSGNGGEILISTPNLEVRAGQILSETVGTGNAPNIAIEVRTVLLDEGETIVAATLGPGQSGNIDLRASDSIFLSNQFTGAFMVGPLLLINGPSGFYSITFADGKAGRITISAPSVILDGGAIFSETFGVAKSADVVVGAGKIQIMNGGLIGSTTFGSGDSGKITVTATESVILSGPRHGFFSVGNFIFGNNPSTISSATLGGGNGATVTITTPMLTMQNGGSIVTGTGGTGIGGDVAVIVGRLIMDSSAQIESGSGATYGNEFFIGNGQGGNINLQAASIQLDNGAIISASSLGPGIAGNISITAGGRFVMRDSTVTTQAMVSDGGNIDIHAGNLVQLTNSSITTSVGTGAGNGGNISVDPQFFILDHSRIIANAVGGNGGNINITAGVFLSDPSSILSASSALGVNGTIQIQSPVQNLSGSLSPLPSSLLKIAPLTSQCAARAQGGSYSSFTVAGRDGVPAEPGGLLPSPLSLMASPAVTARSGREQSPESLPAPLLQLAFALPACPE